MIFTCFSCKNKTNAPNNWFYKLSTGKKWFKLNNTNIKFLTKYDPVLCPTCYNKNCWQLKDIIE